MCCGGGKPNTDGINQAAVQSSATSQEALKWFQDTYAAEAPQRAAAEDRANKVADSQTAAMDFATQEAKDLSDRRKNVAQPLEDQIITDAQGYDTPERRAAARAEAAAGVQSAYGRAQQAQTRQQARMGVDLTSAQNAALMQDAALSKAKAEAGATYMADRNVEQQGHARMMDAAGLTKGIVGSQATQQQIAGASGTGALQASNASLQATNSGTPLMQVGYTSALQGQQTAGNLYGQAAQIQAGGGNQWAQAAAGAGGIMQGLGAIYSSKRLKMDKTPISDEEALAANNRLDVQAWKYKPGAVPGDDGQTKVGPYAEDVKREFGDDVAPNGEMVDMKAMADNNGKSIDALTKMLDKLQAEVAMLEKQRKPAAKKADAARGRARME